jgi:Domain of unknown function (DUF4062)
MPPSWPASGPRCWEYFGASGRPSVTACLERVSRAHVVVAISGHRYGWIPDDQAHAAPKSITWLECEHADGQDKEVLPFIVDEQATWPAEQRD